MKTFTDNAGHVWQISVNVAAIKRVKGMLSIDLLTLIDNKFSGLADLLSNPVQLVDVLYVLCQEQAETLHVSDEDFGRAMAGDVIETATNAFLAEYTDFFPNPRVRESLRKVIAAAGKVRDRLTERMEIEVDGLDVDSVVETLIGSSGGSPVSSASTPDRLPSAN